MKIQNDKSEKNDDIDIVFITQEQSFSNEVAKVKRRNSVILPDIKTQRTWQLIDKHE